MISTHVFSLFLGSVHLEMRKLNNSDYLFALFLALMLQEVIAFVVMLMLVQDQKVMRS